MEAKQLARALIKQLTGELKGAGSDQERAEIAKEQENACALLTFPWASEQGLSSPVTLSDTPDSPHLDHELIAKKFPDPVAPAAGASAVHAKDRGH